MTYQSKTIVSQNLYHVFVASLCGLVVWTGYSAYQIFTVPVAVNVESRVLDPIVVNLDEGMLDVLMQRRYVLPDISTLPTTATPIVVPQPIIAESASPSGEVSEE